MCDICGRRFRASEVREQPHGIWKGLMVCDEDADKYNPQFSDVTAIPDKIIADLVNSEDPAITPEFTYETLYDADNAAIFDVDNVAIQVVRG